MIRPYVVMGFILVIGFVVCVVHLIVSCCSEKGRQQIKAHPIFHGVMIGAILFTLVALFIPVIGTGPHHHCYSATARVEQRTLVMAAEAFLNEYGSLPLQSNVVDHNYTSEHIVLYDSLTGSSNTMASNPRSIVFLEPDIDFYDERESLFVDPWGRPVHILGDWDMDELIIVGSNKIKAIMAVWSSGKDGINNYGMNDDVASWHE